MTLDGFLPFVLPEVIGCPDPIARSAVVLAAAEFCRKTMAWNEVQDPVKLLEGESNYELDVPSESYANSVLEIFIGSRQLKGVTIDALQYELPGWYTAQAAEPDYYNSVVERGVVTVYPQPTNVTTLFGMVMRVAYVPNTNSTTLPDFLGQRHTDTIAAGAKARLMTMPNQSYSNAGLAGYYQKIFDDAVIDTRINEAMGRVNGRLTVKPRSFG
jgi:hypothetical protein